MTCPWFKILFVAGILSVTLPALALSSALEAFHEGQYDQVVVIADQEPSAVHFALAARALNTVAYLATDEQTARHAAKNARSYALAAIRQDEGLTEAYIQAAISDALRGDQVSPVRAFFVGLASRARKALDQALMLEPENPWALSTSGAWHLEVKRAGGGGLYGADAETGYEQMMRARVIMPEDISIAYETSLRLLASENPAWRPAALKALEIAVSGTEHMSAHEKAIQKRALSLKIAIENGPAAEADFIKEQA